MESLWATFVQGGHAPVSGCGMAWMGKDDGGRDIGWKKERKAT